MFTIRERIIQAVIGRYPEPRLSREFTMPAVKLLLVLTFLVRLSEHLPPRISGMLAVFHEVAIPLHQPSSVVKNCRDIRVSFIHKERSEQRTDAKTILLPLHFCIRWDKQLIKSLSVFVI
jgi:hypothetical protein